MPRITIIGCRIFEDEVVHLIEKESRLDEVIILKSESNTGLIRKLEEIGSPHTVLPIEKIREASERLQREKEGQENSDLTIIVNLLEFALDGFPERLREVVYETIENMKEYSDAVLLLYGLCGNVLGSVEKDFEATGFPVFILTDRGGEIVDDCVGAVLGGRGAFLSKLKSEGTGTYFLTPVGAAYWKEMLVASRITPDPENTEMTKMVFDYSGYKNVAKVDTGLHYEKEFETKVKEFADSFGFEVIDMEGSPDLIERCYERAREEVLRKEKRRSPEGKGRRSSEETAP